MRKILYFKIVLVLTAASVSIFANAFDLARVVPKPILVEPIKKIIDPNLPEYPNRYWVGCAIDAEGLKCWGQFYYDRDSIPLFQANVTDFIINSNNNGVCYYDSDEVLKCGDTTSYNNGQSVIDFKFTNISSVYAVEGSYHGHPGQIICVDDFFTNKKRRSCFSSFAYGDWQPNPPPNGFPEFYYSKLVQSQFVDKEEDNSKIKFNACKLSIPEMYRYDNGRYDTESNNAIDRFMKSRNFTKDEQSPIKVTNTAEKSGRVSRTSGKYHYDLKSFYLLPHSTPNHKPELKVHDGMNPNLWITKEISNEVNEKLVENLHYMDFPELHCRDNKKIALHEVRPRISFDSAPTRLGKDTALADHDLRFVRKGYYDESYYTGLDGTADILFRGDEGSFRVLSFRNFHIRHDRSDGYTKIYDRNWKVIKTKTRQSGPWLRRFSAGRKLYSCYFGDRVKCYSVKVE